MNVCDVFARGYRGNEGLEVFFMVSGDDSAHQAYEKPFAPGHSMGRAGTCFVLRVLLGPQEFICLGSLRH